MRKLLVLLFFFALQSGANAQWQRLHDFKDPVWAIRSLDGVGRPNVVLVGAAHKIYRSVDNGFNWVQVGPQLDGHVSNFAFRDGSVGWCSVSNDNPDASVSVACYKTLDGGLSWSPLPEPGSAGDVYYNAGFGRLFLSNRFGMRGTLISTNEGSSWTVVSTLTKQNGFAFPDPSTGIVSAGANAPYLRTTDGGITWKNTGYIYHCWSPCVLPGWGGLLTPNDQAQFISTSGDRGVTWQSGSNLPGLATGCAVANECAVYVQTDQGIYSSLVGELSPGSPGNFPDTRMYLGQQFLYASDRFGLLMRMPIPATQNPLITPMAFSLPDRCTELDTFFTIQNPNCSVYKLTRLELSDSNSFLLYPINFPFLLNTDSVYRIGVHISARGSVTAHVILTRGQSTIDTTVLLSAKLSGPLPLMLGVSGARDYGVVDVCEPIDSAFTIANPLCDSIELLAASFEPPSLGFSITSPTSLPLRIQSHDSEMIRIHFSANSTNAAKPFLHLKFLVDGVMHDTLLLFTASGKRHIDALRSDSAIDFGNISPCVTATQSVFVKNNSCDALELTDLLLGTSSPFIVLSPSLPSTIPGKDSVKVTVRVSPSASQGPHSDVLHAVVNNNAQERTLDFALSAIVQAPSDHYDLSLNKLSLDSLRPCTMFDTSITLTKTDGCDTLTVDSVRYEGSGNILVTSAGSIPVALPPGGMLTSLIRFDASSGEVADGYLHIYGNSFDTVIAIHLSARVDAGAPLVASVDRPALVIHSCAADSAILYLENQSCLTSSIDSLTIISSDPSQSEFNFHDPLSLPITLQPNARIPVRIDFASGAGDGKITLRIHEKGGSVKLVTMSGTILPMEVTSVTFTLASASATNLQAGDEFTTALIFGNAVSSSAQLTELDFTLRYNTDLLTDRTITGQNGWSVTAIRTAHDSIRFHASRTNPLAINAGDAIASLDMRASVADSFSTALGLEHVVFMPKDSTYMQCVLAGGAAGPELTATLAPHCGDSTLSSLLRGSSLVGNISIAPNPVTGGENVSLDFDATRSVRVRIGIVDLLGREEMSQNISAAAGRNHVVLHSKTLQSGTHYISIEAEGTHAMRKILIRR